ncbi:hypothetical protein Xen7305DRAFT_00018490 [Xenococcus sp. PCC 7305]|uniref:YHS domain-containing (seleno)protein n=1 Tax=Xenococcus sp. PCC 7305 TaxID=102125 RepID=UPI0002AC3503|nr:YHS domain-containing (seleno)protein [Xenococcus sp. PCC 7305]ELS02138.1 hypothetical protein Xen7305DRAFT_00018490 [Xenococcus sp. PCC 7305]
MKLKNVTLISGLIFFTWGLTTIVSGETTESNITENQILLAQANSSTTFYEEEGIAIRGADPVAYFTEGKAVIGDKNFSHQWGNTTWLFKNSQNRDLFAQNPEQYAPQYGGFCAWAVSQNYTAPIDPEAWKIVEGKLYLNYNKGVQRRWAKDIPGNIQKGDQNWPGILASL